MSSTKLRHKPIAEQIAQYEKEIANIDIRIAHGKERQRELRRHIRILQRPDAEAKYQARLAQSRRAREAKRLKEEQYARNRARMEREVEECLRMNGKIV